MTLQTMTGGCHCGAVRFRARVDPDARVLACNCSICLSVGFLHVIVPRENFELLSDWEDLALYQFNSGVARHWFCPTCGVKAFYRPRSHPDGISINARCIDGIDLDTLNIEPFDGRNWEANVAGIRADGAR
ncbi:MAG: GFA family protein [Pseudomonadota bacterium]